MSEHRHGRKSSKAFPQLHDSSSRSIQSSSKATVHIQPPSLALSTTSVTTPSTPSHNSRHKRSPSPNMASSSASSSSKGSSKTTPKAKQIKRVSLTTPSLSKNVSLVKFNSKQSSSRARSNTDSFISSDSPVRLSIGPGRSSMKSSSKSLHPTRSLFEENGIYLANITPISVYPINTAADITEIEETFDQFSSLLLARRDACIRRAKKILASRGSKPANGSSNQSKASVPRSPSDPQVHQMHQMHAQSRGGRVDVKGVFIDTAFVFDVIGSIGVDWTRSLHTLRKLENELINKMKQVSSLEEKIEGYQKELEHLRTVESPRIAAEIKVIQTELESIVKKPRQELNSSRKKLSKIRSSDLNDVRALPKPHKLLVSTIQACALMVGKIDPNHSVVDVANNVILFSPGAGVSTGCDGDAGDNLDGSFSEKMLSVNNLKIGTNWNELRKVLKPSFLEELSKLDPKSIPSDTKDFIKEFYFLTNSAGEIVLEDPSLSSTQGARNSLHVRKDSQTADFSGHNSIPSLPLSHIFSRGTSAPNVFGSLATSPKPAQQKFRNTALSPNNGQNAQNTHKINSDSPGCAVSPGGNGNIKYADIMNALGPKSKISHSRANSQQDGKYNSLHGRFDSNLSESGGANYLYNLDKKLTLSGVNKVNAKVAGVLLQHLVAVIKCSDMLPKGRELKSRLEKNCTDLELNNKRVCNMEDLVFEFERSISVYRKQANRYVTNILTLQHSIDSDMHRDLRDARHSRESSRHENEVNAVNGRNGMDSSDLERKLQKGKDAERAILNAKERINKVKRRINDLKEKGTFGYVGGSKNNPRGPKGSRASKGSNGRGARNQQKQRPQSARSSADRGPRSSSARRAREAQKLENQVIIERSDRNDRPDRGTGRRKEQKQGFHASQLILVGDGSNVMLERENAALSKLSELPEVSEHSDNEAAAKRKKRKNKGKLGAGSSVASGASGGARLELRMSRNSSGNGDVCV